MLEPEFSYQTRNDNAPVLLSIDIVFRKRPLDLGEILHFVVSSFVWPKKSLSKIFQLNFYGQNGQKKEENRRTSRPK